MVKKKHKGSAVTIPEVAPRRERSVEKPVQHVPASIEDVRAVHHQLIDEYHEVFAALAEA